MEIDTRSSSLSGIGGSSNKYETPGNHIQNSHIYPQAVHQKYDNVIFSTSSTNNILVWDSDLIILQPIKDLLTKSQKACCCWIIAHQAPKGLLYLNPEDHLRVSGTSHFEIWNVKQVLTCWPLLFIRSDKRNRYLMWEMSAEKHSRDSHSRNDEQGNSVQCARCMHAV